MKNQLIEIRKEFALSGFSEKTQAAYSACLRQFQEYYKTGLENISKEQIKDYLYYLIDKRHLSVSSLKQYYYSIRYFYLKMHGKDMMEGFPEVKGRTMKLPQALARDEVKDIINSLSNIKHKTMLITTYSGGLRVSETAHLLVSDIDSKRMMIRVSQGKGKKDRYTLLSNANLKYLRIYYKQYRPKYWLFSGYDRTKPISTRTIEHVFDVAKQKAGIIKDVGIHSLRHSFATHLIESGIDVHYVQKFLGHSSIKTTAIYLHLTHSKLFNIQNPIDFPEL